MTLNSKEYTAKWRAKNKDKTKEYAKRHREKRGPIVLSDEEKLKQKEYMTIYWKANRKILREKKKFQIANNPEYAASLLQSKKNWQKRNLDKIAKYERERKQKDLNYKLRAYIRTRIYKAVKTKIGSAVDDLGCSIDEFKLYIEKKFDPWMSWENYGEWELDHIIPLAKFDLTIKEQFVKAVHYINYQPLWRSINRRKRDKLI